jgi:poly(3-hydroxyalkanoate) depolymerase
MTDVLTADAPPTEERMVHVGSYRIRVVERPGDGTEPPLLLMSGFGCSLEVMAPLVEALDPSTGVIRFDVPGIGRSRRPLRPYRLSELAWVLGELVDQLGHSQVDALGVSWGGALAQQFALQHPRHCRRLVLVSTGAAPIMRPSFNALRELVASRRFDPNQGGDVAAELYGGKVLEDRSLLSVIQERLPNERRGERYQQLALLGWSSLPLLPLIRQQTLVLAGSDDRIVPMLNARILSTMLPRARLRVFHDGHLGLLTSADEVAPMIEEFRHYHRAAEAS